MTSLYIYSLQIYNARVAFYIFCNGEQFSYLHEYVAELAMFLLFGQEMT